jgi:hypothetical protein
MLVVVLREDLLREVAGQPSQEELLVVLMLRLILVPEVVEIMPQALRVPEGQELL